MQNINKVLKSWNVDNISMLTHLYILIQQTSTCSTMGISAGLFLWLWEIFKNIFKNFWVTCGVFRIVSQTSKMERFAKIINGFLHRLPPQKTQKKTQTKKLITGFLKLFCWMKGVLHLTNNILTCSLSSANTEVLEVA